jgi:putative two-component system response regulator
VTVADVFDAITSTRPYRTALALEEAREEITRGSGSQFDPAVVDAFLRVSLERLDEINRHYASLASGEAPGAPALAQTR